MQPRNKIAIVAAASTAGLLLAESAFALPAEATTAFQQVGSSVEEVLALIWPIAIAMTTGFITLKLFKKGANKAV